MSWYEELLGGGEDSGGNNTGLVGNALGIGAGLDARDKKKRNRQLEEFRRQQRNEGIFNYENQQRATESMQDLAPELTGALESDYLTGSMLMPTDRNQIGGAALENLSNASSGYNPTMGFDPMLGVLGADRQAVSGLKNYAQARTEDTLGGWEDAMKGLASDYDTAAGELRDTRDESRDLYKETVAGNRTEGDAGLAKAVVESWIDSNDTAGVEDMPGFVKQRGRRGKRNTANKRRKREFIEAQLASGATYEDIINDPEFIDNLSSDKNSGPLLSMHRESI